MLVAVVWIFDLIFAGVRREARVLTAMMMAPSTVGAVRLSAVETSLVLTWSAVIVRPRSESLTMPCMA